MHGGGGARGGGGFRGGGFGGGGFRGGPRPGPHMHFYGPRWGFFGPRWGMGGCLSSMVSLVLVAIILIIGLVAMLFDSADIVKSDKDRVKLDASYVQKVSEDWYSDEGHLAIKVPVREKEMVNAMRYFYDQTGVQPYLYITDNLDGNYSPLSADFDSFGKKLYSEKFGNDGGHLIVLCVQSADSFSYSFTIDADMYIGTDAASVIDDNAYKIFFSYLSEYFDAYYNNNTYEYEEVFTKTFHDSADRIMGGKTGFTEDWSAGVWLLLVVGVILVVVIVIQIIRSKKQGASGQNDSAYRGGNSGWGNNSYGGDDNNYSKF